MVKICPKCQHKHVQKFGIQDGRQRYKCMECRHIFRSPRRTKARSSRSLVHAYGTRKQTLSELADDKCVSIRTIHRRITSALNQQKDSIRLNPNLSSYTSSVLILDATFFGKKGSLTQWGILVAQDGITGDILASRHIFQETTEGYRILLGAMKREGCPRPHFAVIDGRNGVESVIHIYYDSLPVQICQSHKIATIDRYLLKRPRLESYRVLKQIAHDMTRTDRGYIHMDAGGV